MFRRNLRSRNYGKQNAKINYGFDKEDSTDDEINDESEESRFSKLNLNNRIEVNDSDAGIRDEEDGLEYAAAKYFAGYPPVKQKLTKKSGGGAKNSKREEKTKEISLDLPVKAIHEWLRKSDDFLPSSATDLLKKYRRNYARWILCLSEGFNVLLYGYGSKKELLNDFCSEKLSGRYNYMIIRGYSTNFRLKEMLINLAERLKIVIESFSNVVNVAFRLKNELNKRDDVEDVVLVIYNIDGPNLRDDACQTALSLLAGAEKIHIIASMDNVNSFVFWDLKKLESFNWNYLDTPTYRSYVDEIAASGNSKILGFNAKSAANLHNLSSLQSVWASLTDNARQIFSILAKKQLNARQQTSHSVTFWDLYKICRDEFVVSSEAALHQQMVEFEDHNLIIKRTAVDGSELLQLAVEENVLDGFINQQNNLVE